MIVPPITLRARLFLHRHRFAGHHRFVDRAAALDHHAVHWDAVARTDSERVADLDLLERHLFIVAVVADAPSGFRREVQQGADRASGLLSRAQFENLAEQDKHRDDGSRLVIDGNDSACLLQSLRKEFRREGSGKAVEIGGTDTQCD